MARPGGGLLDGPPAAQAEPGVAVDLADPDARAAVGGRLLGGSGCRSWWRRGCRGHARTEADSASGGPTKNDADGSVGVVSRCIEEGSRRGDTHPPSGCLGVGLALVGGDHLDEAVHRLAHALDTVGGHQPYPRPTTPRHGKEGGTAVTT